MDRRADRKGDEWSEQARSILLNREEAADRTGDESRYPKGRIRLVTSA